MNSLLTWIKVRYFNTSFKIKANEIITLQCQEIYSNHEHENTLTYLKRINIVQQGKIMEKNNWTTHKNVKDNSCLNGKDPC